MSSLSFHRISAVLCAVLCAVLLIVIMLSLLEMQPTYAATNSKILNYFYSISGTKTVSGQHNREPNSDPARWTNWIYSVTGKYPGLWGGDFLFRSEDIQHRWTMITEAKNQWNNGALVTLMWHVCPPTISEPCELTDVMSDLSDVQWSELVSDGSTLNNEWKARIDTIVDYLQDLKDNGGEVLWRPLHEMNADWCWWCGRTGPTGSLKLYQITHDYMVYTKGLTNLIWVWNVKDVTPTTTVLTATLEYSSYYPGDRYVDVVSIDPWNYGFTPENYSATLNIAKGKPIAIGESDKLPSPTVLAAQPGWTWFLGWAELVKASNTITEIRAVYNDCRVVNRGLIKDCVWLPVILHTITN